MSALETSVLGALLDASGPVMKSSAQAILSATSLRPDDFADARVKTAWNAAIRLTERGHPVNAAAVWAAGKTIKAFSDTDLTWLKSLEAQNQLDRPTFSFQAGELVRGARALELKGALREHLKRLEVPGVSPATVQASLEAFLSRFAAVNAPDETGDVDVMELAAEQDATEAGKKPLIIPTGIQALDEVIGGFVPNLNMIGGLPGLGKSAVAGEIILNHLKAGMRVGLFGLEDGTKWLAKRHLARATGIPVKEVGRRKLFGEQADRFQQAAGQLAQLLRNLFVFRRAGISRQGLIQRSKDWIYNKGVQEVWVDHGGEVDHAGEHDRHDLNVGKTYGDVRDLAYNAQVPFVMLAHLAREKVIPNFPPNMDAFAESAYIERRARLALMLWTMAGERDYVRCQVAKQTEGEMNVCVRLKRDKTSALVFSDGGDVVDLAEERAQRQDEARQKKKAQTREAEHQKKNWKRDQGELSVR